MIPFERISDSPEWRPTRPEHQAAAADLGAFAGVLAGIIRSEEASNSGTHTGHGSGHLPGIHFDGRISGMKSTGQTTRDTELEADNLTGTPDAETDPGIHEKHTAGTSPLVSELTGAAAQEVPPAEGGEQLLAANGKTPPESVGTATTAASPDADAKTPAIHKAAPRGDSGSPSGDPAKKDAEPIPVPAERGTPARATSGHIVPHPEGHEHDGPVAEASTDEAKHSRAARRANGTGDKVAELDSDTAPEDALTVSAPDEVHQTILAGEDDALRSRRSVSRESGWDAREVHTSRQDRPAVDRAASVQPEFREQNPGKPEGALTQDAAPPPSDVFESLTLSLKDPLPASSGELLSVERGNPSSVDTASNRTEHFVPPRAPALRAAWLPFVREQVIRSFSTADGWNVMKVELPDEEGSMTIKTRRGPEAVHVVAGFSDSRVQQMMAGHLHRLEADLSLQYGTTVDFSLSTDHRQHDDDRDGGPVRSGRGGLAAVSLNQTQAVSAIRSLSASREWIA